MNCRFTQCCLACIHASVQQPQMVDSTVLRVDAALGPSFFCKLGSSPEALLPFELAWHLAPVMSAAAMTAAAPQAGLWLLRLSWAGNDSRGPACGVTVVSCLQGRAIVCIIYRSAGYALLLQRRCQWSRGAVAECTATESRPQAAMQPASPACMQARCSVDESSTEASACMPIAVQVYRTPAHNHLTPHSRAELPAEHSTERCSCGLHRQLSSTRECALAAVQ